MGHDPYNTNIETLYLLQYFKGNKRHIYVPSSQLRTYLNFFLNAYRIKGLLHDPSHLSSIALEIRISMELGAYNHENGHLQEICIFSFKPIYYNHKNNI